MPELPEVETVCRTLRPLLVGQRVERFELLWDRTLADIGVDDFHDAVVAASVANVTRRAKLIVIELDTGGAVTVHLRMTGELLFVLSGAAPPPADRLRYLRAAFSLSSGDQLLFFDVRKFGRIAYHPPSDMRRFAGTYGPEPLDETFTLAAFAELLGRHRRQLKPLLLDQRVIAGLGNIYVDESLFRAGVHPRAHPTDLSPEQTAALYTAIRSVLTEAIDRQGTTLRNYRTGTGAQGSNQTRLQVYGARNGAPCPVCAAPLERLVVGQRGTVMCPRCQALPTARKPSR